MKRKEKLITLFILIMILTITLIYKEMTPQNVMKTNETKNKLISMMYEQEDGKYVTSEENKWPIRSYVFNQEKSYCENKSTLEWNNVSKRIKVKVTGTDKCYVYFDLEELGTKESPYRIRVIEDLVDLANEVNKGENYVGKIFTLEKDLDFHNPSDYENAYRRDYGDINKNNQDETLIEELTNKDGSGFMPIGTDANSFSGIFNGNNKTIDNLYIKKDNESIGFFRRIDSATIENLTLKGNIYKNNAGEAGGLIGFAFNKNIIENYHNEVNVYNESGSNTAGGILGSARGGSTIIIKNSDNKGEISGGAETAGLVAYVNGNITIENSANYGHIINEYGTFLGGLMGIITAGNNYQTTITNSFNKGKIEANNQATGNTIYIGGLAGQIYSKLLINKCYNLGQLLGVKTTNRAYIIGGIMGDIISNQAYILNTYNNGNLENNSTKTYVSSSGLVGKAEDSSNIFVINSYNAGKVGVITDRVETGENYANGLYFGINAHANRKIYMNNVYNFGELVAIVKSGIGYLPPAANFTINNTYYRTGTGITASSQGNVGTGMDYTQMQKQDFVNTLNSNLANINLGTALKEIVADGLLGWKLGSDNIPTFDEEKIYYPFTNNYQIFEAQKDGTYKIELWGSQGDGDITAIGGKGGYTSGNIFLKAKEKLYLYVGSQSGYNGGGNANVNYLGYAGGGATDVRLINGDWNNFDSLKSRIMVAAGGGGAQTYHKVAAGGYGGGLTGGPGIINGVNGQVSSGANQTGVGTGASQNGFTELPGFGKGGQGKTSGGGGGGGYYGAYAGAHGDSTTGSGGGGSAFISGYPGCNAISSSSVVDKITHTGQATHYSNKKFFGPVMIAGNSTMPSPSGSTETGHSGNGYAKISLIKNVISDLSGNGNDGLDFTVSKSNEGYTTSNNSQVGYINAGLINYDFGNSLSFVTRVKFNRLEGYQEFMNNFAAAGGGLVFDTSKSKIFFSVFAVDMQPADYYFTSYSTTTIEVNKWYTVIGTYDGTYSRLYINGQEEGNNTITGKIKPSSMPIIIGGNSDGTPSNVIAGNPSYTTLSDVLIFDRALTAEEIAKNYVDIPNPENKDELLVWYKLSK